ncbi:MAG: sulfatase-like hydrolase/transferase, partial [Planctomycetales bacterium]|nr:sulfatase-like hydrolase/transferase [Planctomycetales bacterium]
ETTLGEVLAGTGYATGFFGKWHLNQHFERKYLAWHPEFGPRQQGFDVAGEDFGDHPYAWVRKRRPADAPEGEFPADTMFEQANEFIRRRHERPFFLMVSTFYVHTPVKNRCRWLVNEYETLVPANARSRPRRLEYAAFVETLDHHIGSLLQTIDQAGLRDNTLVVFMSDNGGHPEYCSNAPLRGSKWNLYEGGIRVPLIARWPAKIKAGMVCDAPVIGYDLLPTFAELAGGSAPQLDGRSMADLFADPQARREPRPLLWHFPYYHPESTFSKAQDRIGVADFAMSKTRPHSAIREGDYKLLKFAEDQRVELYNLAADLSESRDLSQQSPEIAARLDRKLESMLTDMKARRATKRKSSN